MRVFLLDQFGRVYHYLIVYAGQAVDYLVKHLDAGIWALCFLGNDFKDVPVEIEPVFQLGDLVFQLEVFLLQ